MKTFLFSIPQRIRFKSMQFDAAAILCNKEWIIFNDQGVKQVFIFNTDNSLIISTDGVVTNSIWKYIPVNNSVIIESGQKAIMLHPAFLDETVLALEQDGGRECLFMIDKKNKGAFAPKTLQQLTSYFNDKEQMLIEEEKRREFERIQHEEQRKRKLEEKRVAEEKERQVWQQKQYERQLNLEAQGIVEDLFPSWIMWIVMIPCCIITFIGLYLCNIMVDSEYLIPEDIAILFSVGIPLLFLFVPGYLLYSIKRKKIEKWKQEHRDDPHCKYMDD